MMYHQEDEYERPREPDQLMKNEIYANCVNGNYSHYTNEIPLCSGESKSEGTLNDNIVYENDKHAAFMYKNDVSLTEEIYVNELMTEGEPYVNASKDRKDLDFEGEYVYADVHSTTPRHKVSTQVKEKTSTAVGAIDGGTRTDVAKENRIISRFSTDIRPPTNVDSKEINELEHIYENNNFHVMLGSDDVRDQTDTNKEDEQDEIYVQMHSGSRRQVDNGDYLIANQERENVNGDEFGQLYANAYEYYQDEKEGDFYTNLPK